MDDAETSVRIARLSLEGKARTDREFVKKDSTRGQAVIGEYGAVGGDDEDGASSRASARTTASTHDNEIAHGRAG